MTRNQIIKLAREAGTYTECDDGHYFLVMPESCFERFATLVAAHEREACAKVCEKEINTFLSSMYATGQPLSSFKERFACKTCAAAIRARS